MNGRIFLLILLFFSCSCNYKIFVNKDRVLNIREGYLLFLNRQKIFFPAKNIKENNFFELKNEQTGYIIEFDKEEDALYSAGEKHTVDYSYDIGGDPLLIRDTIVVLPVSIMSIPYKSTGRVGNGALTIKYHDKVVRLKYLNTNNEAVWSVTPLLDKDALKASKYYD